MWSWMTDAWSNAWSWWSNTDNAPADEAAAEVDDETE